VQKLLSIGKTHTENNMQTTHQMEGAITTTTLQAITTTNDNMTLEVQNGIEINVGINIMSICKWNL